jgi:hypothetical protein
MSKHMKNLLIDSLTSHHCVHNNEDEWSDINNSSNMLANTKDPAVIVAVE